MSKLSRFPFVWLLVLTICSFGITGCGGSDDSGSSTSNDETNTTSSTDQEEKEPEVLLQPFDAPPLEELEAKVKWVDRPVLDAMELMREKQANETPMATVEEALALKNDSPENNKKILSALGRLPASESEIDYEATLNRHASSDVKSTNPLIISLTVEFEFQGLTAFELFSFDWNFNPFAKSATVKSWQTSEDGLYDKVVMRDDMTWSDGTPITAHDVVFSFQTIMNPKVPVPAVRSGTDQIRWIEAYDDYTLVYFHKDALVTNNWNLNFPVIPKHIYEESIKDDFTLQQSDYHVKYENAPVVGGPYKISSRTPKVEFVLERREDYYMHNGTQVRPKPNFKEVRFKILEDPNTALLALKNGEIEEMMLTADLWKTQTDGDEFYKLNTKVTEVEWVSFHFTWNTKTPYFEDRRVRQAMSYAFDHDEMLNTLLYGLATPCTGTFHPDSWMSYKGKIEPYKQDLDKAEDLLDEAGWDDSDGDGIRDKSINGKTVPFDFSLLCSDFKFHCDFFAAQENLDRIGVICHVKPMEFPVMVEKTRKHEYQAAFAGWGTGTDPDTSENLWTTKAIKNGRNYGSYSNSEVDELFEAGKREFDRDKRAEIYGKIQKILWDDQPYTWLFYRNAFYGFNKQLRGYFFSPRGPYTYGPGIEAIYKPVMK